MISSRVNLYGNTWDKISTVTDCVCFTDSTCVKCYRAKAQTVKSIKMSSFSAVLVNAVC